MERNPIAIENFSRQSLPLFRNRLAAAHLRRFSAAEQYNAMTISWGSLGVMWDRPFVQVVVRPQRYTFEFMERFDTFTVCAFPKRVSPGAFAAGDEIRARWR